MSSVFLLYFRNVVLHIILGSYFFIGVTCLSSLVGSSEVLAKDVVPVEMTIQDKKDLKRVAVYLEAIKTLRGGFLQVSSNGRVSSGKIFMSRPGRMRF